MSVYKGINPPFPAFYVIVYTLYFCEHHMSCLLSASINNDGGAQSIQKLYFQPKKVHAEEEEIEQNSEQNSESLVGDCVVSCY